MITAIDQRSIDQITAGKVVVTLAMAIKELVENSIDSGATSIHVRLDNYGLDGFAVTDNGSGIDEQDYELVARKYTTSKLTRYEDLDAIETLGFRGEALGSLCAMARVAITTNTRAAGSGHALTFGADGELLEKKTAPSPKGTTVKITDLFHTAPVRRKDFERHCKNEYTKMVNLVQSYALVAPVKFVVENIVKNRKIVAIQSQGSTMDKRIAAVYGVSALKGLVPVDLKTRVFDLHGYISEPVFGKGRQSTDRQLLYVNSRPATLPKLQKTITAAYQLSNSTEYPFFVLNLVLDPTTFDVNLSADKRTLLLHNEAQVLTTLRESLTEFFEKSDHNVPRASQPMPKRAKTDSVAESLQKFLGSGPIVPQGRVAADDDEDDDDDDEDEGIHIQLRKTDVRSRPSSSRPSSRTAPDMSLSGFISAADLPDTPPLPSEPPRVTERPQTSPSERPRTRSAEEPPRTRSAEQQRTRREYPEAELQVPALDMIFKETGPLSEISTAVSGESLSAPSSAVADVVPDVVPDVEMQDSAPLEVPAEAPVEQEVDIAESLNMENKQPEEGSNQLGRTLNTHISLPISLDQVENELLRLRPHAKNNILNHSIEETGVEERLSLTVRKEDFASMRVVGQFNLGFILVVKLAENGGHDDLFVIDQHASDEIFNFERLQTALQMNRQPLVQPRPLELSPVEELTVMNHMDVFENNGFSIAVVPDAPPGKQCQLTALPYSKNWVFGEKDVHELIYKIQENPADRSIKCSSLRAMIAMRACRSSIMIGRPLSLKTMSRVVSNLGTLNKPWNCPHGRPTLRHITSLT